MPALVIGRAGIMVCGYSGAGHPSFRSKSGDHQVFPQHEEVGCIGLRREGGLVAALRSGIWFPDAQGKPQRKIADNPGEASKSRFNDGRVDPFGRFWCGSLWEPQDRNGGKLCLLDKDLQLHVVDDDVQISNGLAFSPDRRWVYHSDTPHHVIWRYSLDPVTGAIGKREAFRRFSDGLMPDGAAVDAEGFTGRRCSTAGASCASIRIRRKSWMRSRCRYAGRQWWPSAAKI